MKRIILVLLALIFVLATFASCGDAAGANATTPKPSQSKPKEDGSDETPLEEQLNIDIDNVDYADEAVHIFHWVSDNAEFVEFGMEEEDIQGNAVNDAIYKRNLYTEQALGITLDFYKQTKSGYNNTSNFITKLTTRISDPNTPVDIVAGQARVMPYVLIEGLLTDLNTYSDSLDLEKAWWPENCQDVCEIKDKLYFVSGDISANMLRSMLVLFVNKKTLNSLGFNYNSVMEDIKVYKWTLDDLIAMTENCYQNLDTDPEPSEGDKFGLVTLYYYSDALYSGLGYSYMVKSNKDDEVFRLSSHITGELAGNYVTKLQDWKASKTFHMPYNEGYYKDVFENGNSLFILQGAWYGFELQKTDIQYAVLPVPAFDDNQGRYYTTIGNGFTGFGVCEASNDYDRAAQTLQVLGYYAYQTTTPALFEVSFKGKFSKDDYTIEMFDIIRSSVVFDVGRIYDVFVAGITSEDRQYMITNVVSWTIRDDLVWTTEFSTAGKQRLVRSLIDAANKKLLDYVNAE